MQDNLLLGRERVQFASELIQISVDYRCASFGCAFENSMFDKMRYATVEPSFIACAAFDAEGAIGDRGDSLLDGILHAALRFSSNHTVYLLR